MSYILSFENDYYRPSENLRRLFKDQVIRPFETHPRTQPWIDHVINKNHTYHREKILEHGRTNFDKPFRGLTPENKVLLYCLYYMPMHLFSSYYIFTRYLAPMNDKVVFIDFGCGPLTSGIAFWAAFAGQSDATYIGIDKSEAMLNVALRMNESSSGSGAPFYHDFHRGRDYNGLPEFLSTEIRLDNPANTLIIFNLSYFLASKTLNVENLSDCLTQIVAKYSQHRMCMIYQNPKSPDLPHNWRTLKGKLSTFKSQVTQSDESDEKFSCDWLRLQNGRLIWSRTKRPIDVCFDILSNESSFSTFHFRLP